MPSRHPRRTLPPICVTLLLARQHLPAIYSSLDHRLSNGLIESVNTKIRVITRMAFGFHNATALIGLAMLTLGGLRPDLPGR